MSSECQGKFNCVIRQKVNNITHKLNIEEPEVLRDSTGRTGYLLIFTYLETYFSPSELTHNQIVHTLQSYSKSP